MSNNNLYSNSSPGVLGTVIEAWLLWKGLKAVAALVFGVPLAICAICLLVSFMVAVPVALLVKFVVMFPFGPRRAWNQLCDEVSGFVEGCCNGWREG